MTGFGTFAVNRYDDVLNIMLTVYFLGIPLKTTDKGSLLPAGGRCVLKE